MDALIRDVDYALRTLRKSRVFTAVAVATLALGIGANVAVFSVIDAVVLRPLPYPDPTRLLLVLEANEREGWSEFPAAWANVQDWQRGSRSLDTLAGFSERNFTVTGAQQPEQLYGYGITRGFMEMLGVQPASGRLFRPEEYGPEGNAVALISDTFWDRQFGRDPDAVGHTLILDGVGVSVVGILPPEAVDPVGQEFHLTVPLSFAARDLTSRAARQLVVYGRLAPEASLDRARAELTAIASGLALEFPETNRDWTVTVQSLTEQVVGPVRPRLLAVQGVVLLVLLIAQTPFLCVGPCLLDVQHRRPGDTLCRGQIVAFPVQFGDSVLQLLLFVQIPQMLVIIVQKGDLIFGLDPIVGKQLLAPLGPRRVDFGQILLRCDACIGLAQPGIAITLDQALEIALPLQRPDRILIAFFARKIELLL